MTHLHVSAALGGLLSVCMAFVGCDLKPQTTADDAARRLECQNPLVGELADGCLFGVKIGSKFPVGCPRMVGEPESRFRAFAFHLVSTNLVWHELVARSSGEDSQIERVFAVVDRKSRAVVGVCGRLGRPRQRFALHDERFEELLSALFERFGACEVKLGEDGWDSGDIFKTTFFLEGAITVELDYHTQFGTELTIYRTGCEGLDLRHWDVISEAGVSHTRHMTAAGHPAAYDHYRRTMSARRGSSALVAKHFKVSSANLVSGRLAVGPGRFLNVKSEKSGGDFDDSVQFSEPEDCNSINCRRISAHQAGKLLLAGEMYFCDSPEAAFKMGLDIMTCVRLPASALCEKYRLVRGVPDICFATSDKELSEGWHGAENNVRIILMNGNVVLDCSVRADRDAAARHVQRAVSLYRRECVK